MATIDTANFRNQAEQVHAGINAVICHVSLSVSLSVGDVHRIGRLFASLTYSQAAAPIYRNIRKIGVTQQISLSDDARVLYEPLVMVATAGVSVGHVGDLVVFYKMPGQPL
jgi:hypothetical protein